MIGGDEVARTVPGVQEALARAAPAGVFESGEGAVLWLCGALLPALNGVIVWSADAEVRELDRLLDAAESSRLPYSLQLRPTTGPGLVAAAVRRGLHLVEHTPLMVCERLDPPTTTPDGLTVRALDPSEVDTHLELLAAAFEMPAEELRTVTTPALLRTPGVRAYVGEVGGRPVGTALAVASGGGVCVSNVATPPAGRRRGYGTALTAAAVSDGLAGGARFAWLQSSGLGDAIYRRLGFRTVERWPFWVSAV